MLISVLGILACIFCLCSATWAWFGSDISYDNNTVSAGIFDLSMTVTDSEGNTIPHDEMIDGGYVITLKESESEYTVTLEMTDDTTVTKGFCTIHVGDTIYRTASININGTNPFIFNIKVSGADVTVTFTPSWGIPANESVGMDGTLDIIVDDEKN